VTTLQPVTDPAELEHASTLTRRIVQARTVHERCHLVIQATPEPGSDLAGDDAATAWMYSSHLVKTALTMASDNLRAVTEMLLPGDHLVVPLYAHYPVLRSVLEAAALAKWLLAPAEREERIVRALRARATDAKHDLELAREERETVRAMDEAPNAADLAKHELAAKQRYARDLAKIRDIAQQQGIPAAAAAKDLPPWIHIIRAVCTVESSSEWVRVPGGYAASVWKIMSGLSHPSASRSINHSVVEELPNGREGNVFTGLVTASLHWTVQAMAVGMNTTSEALDLLEQRQRLLRV
jgi:hypothetical protein